MKEQGRMKKINNTSTRLKQIRAAQRHHRELGTDFSLRNGSTKNSYRQQIEDVANKLLNESSAKQVDVSNYEK